MPAKLFAGPKAIWRSIPAKFRIPHVVENGTLLIERRWIDNELPDMEVLEALAHVYSQFCVTIIDLLERNGVAVPPQLGRSRPDAMGELAMDRAVYLSMADGEQRGLRYFKKPFPPPQDHVRAKVEKRYGAFGGGASRLKDAQSLRHVAAAFFENARAVMRRDGFHHNMTFLMKGMRPIQMMKTDHPDRATRYVMMRDLARLARIAGADGVMMIGEAWTARSDNAPASGFAVDAPDRGESILLHAADAKGDSFVIGAEVARKRPGSRKVKRVGPGEVSDEGFQFLFLPFFEEWGCLDHEALKRALAQQGEMGIENPTVT